MVRRGMNLENIKKSNRSAILQTLQKHGALSRKDIASLVGLTPASVTIICSELLEEGILVELGEAVEEKRAGRKKILVSINSDYKYVLCMGIEENETYLSIVNLSGQIIGSQTMPSDLNGDPEGFLRKAAMGCKAMLWEYQIPKEKILAVGVSIPGKVDRKRGVRMKTSGLSGGEIPIRRILQEELCYDVIIENNVKAYAKTEIVFGNGRSEDHIFMLKWGPGVGSAIIINGEIYRGSTGTAAEIGHTMVRKDGKLCKCGRTGCLETEISTHAIMNAIQEAYDSCSRPEEEMPEFHAWLQSGHQLRYNNSGEWGALQDKKLQAILQERAEYLAIATRNAVSLVDPDKIVVWGYLFDIPGLFEKFQEFYCSFDQERTKEFIVKSELQVRNTHTEALSIVMDELI